MTALAPAPARPTPRTGVLPGLALLVLIAAGATALSWVVPVMSPLVAGLALGALVVNLVPIPDHLAPGIAFGGRSLLRLGIVLLGFRLSVGDVARLGLPGLGVVAVVVAGTFFGTQWLGRRLGVSEDLGLLVATGYSICGASAIAAMDGVVHADEEETAYAITLVTLCGTLSIFVLPLIAHAVGMPAGDFGTWVGGSVHDVGQVVATASQEGPRAVAAATVVKLTRVVLLAPLVATVALRRRGRAHRVRDRRAAPADPPAVRVRLPRRHHGALEWRALAAPRWSRSPPSRSWCSRWPWSGWAWGCR